MNTPRVLFAVVIVALLAVAAWWLTNDANGAATNDVVRPAPAVPRGLTEQDRIAYFYELMISGRRVGVAGIELQLWQQIGEKELVARGRPALDYLIDPARFPAYHRSPNTLITVLRILPLFPEARKPIPALMSFFAHWLDPENCPQTTPRANWAAEIRLRVFGSMKELARAEMAPLVLPEFDREERVHDLRAAATDILLNTGRADDLLARYDALPPTKDDKQPDLKTQLIVRLYHMAKPGLPEDVRAQVTVLEAILRREAQSPVAARRLNASAALLRLGDDSMAKALIREYERERDSDPKAAFTALDLLVKDRPHPYVREVALAAVKKRDGSLPFLASAGFLANWWRDEPPVKKLLWGLVDARAVKPLMLVPRLSRSDHARAVQWVEGEFASADWARITDALRFVRGASIREVGPQLLDMVRGAEPGQRPALYATLAALETPGVESLLIAELSGAASPQVRDAAVTELLNLGASAGIKKLAEVLAAGDRTVLHALLRRTQTLGARGLPDALLGGVLNNLRSLPSEDGRRLALYVLRYRGTPTGVEKPLVEAYRREPSRRVAAEIREVIAELAHRR